MSFELVNLIQRNYINNKSAIIEHKTYYSVLQNNTVTLPNTAATL